MTNRDYLFSQDSLRDQLSLRLNAAQEFVDQLPEGQFLASNDDQILEHAILRATVYPLELAEDKMTMTTKESQVDVSGDWRRIGLRHHSGPYYIHGTEVCINIPFSGDNFLFRYRPDSYFSEFPTGRVNKTDRLGGILEIRLSIAHDADQSELKSNLDRNLDLIKKFIQNSKTQVEGSNRNAAGNILTSIRNRRERLRKKNDIAVMLNIPLAKNPDAPSITPVKIEIVKPAPLPVPPKTGLKPEPGIKPEDYEHILHFIRHQGRTFEAKPTTFNKFDEEELRDVILAQLNGHFKGGATGETFRQLGKTDISIEQDDRAAFIGECKVWAGEKVAAEAISQLLSYLTWRDSKAALIFFNKTVKSFSAVQENLPAAVRAHANFIEELKCAESGEWRVLMRSAEDEGRRVTMHVFAFNIYVDAGPRIRKL